MKTITIGVVLALVAMATTVMASSEKKGPTQVIEKGSPVQLMWPESEDASAHSEARTFILRKTLRKFKKLLERLKDVLKDFKNKKPETMRSEARAVDLVLNKMEHSLAESEGESAHSEARTFFLTNILHKLKDLLDSLKQKLKDFNDKLEPDSLTKSEARTHGRILIELEKLIKELLKILSD